MSKFKIIFIIFINSFTVYGQLVHHFSGITAKNGLLNHDNKDSVLYNSPHGIDIAPDGTIYIADRFNHVIRRISIDGKVTTIAGTGFPGDINGFALNAQFNEPWGVSAGNNGEVFVADSRNNKIKVILPDGRVETYAGTGNAGFSDNDNPLISSFFWPGDVEFDHNSGDLYVSGHLSHLIRKINVERSVTTFAGSKLNFPDNHGVTDGVGSRAQFYRPYGIHLDGEGNLYVADEWNSLIRKISSNGFVSTIGGKGGVVGYMNGSADSSRFNYPWDVTTDMEGNIYVLDGYNHVIRKIDPQTHESSLFAGTPSKTGGVNGPLLEAQFNGATSLKYNRFDGCLYIADAYNHVIRKIELLEKITLNLDHDTLCVGDTSRISAYPAYYDNYYWYINDELFTITNTPELSELINETSSINVIGERTGSGMITSDTVVQQIISSNQANVLFDSSKRICFGDTVLLSSNYSNAIWSTEEIQESIQVSEDGFYSFEYFIGNCSFETEEVAVLFDRPPSIDVNFTQVYLGTNNYIDLVASGAEHYQWSNGSTRNTVRIYEPTILSVTGSTIKGGCVSSSVDITVKLRPEINAYSDKVEVPFMENISFNLLENDEFNSPVIVSMDLSRKFPITINRNENVLELYNESQLSDTIININYSICYANLLFICDSAEVSFLIKGTLENDAKALFFPNGFSPNNDGKNDFFEILGVEKTPENYLEIYNRWGQLVYSKTKYFNDWGGNNQDNNQLIEGTYFYIFTDTISHRKYHGYVVLKR